MKNQFFQWHPTLVAFCLALTSVTTFGESSTSTAVVASAGKLELQMHQTANSDELLLTLSGAQPKKYYVLSTPSVSNLAWSVETVVDGAVSSSVTIHVAGRSQAFFTAIPEDEFSTGNISNLVAVAAGAAAKNVTSQYGGKEWFVDRKIGHDSFDGRTKNRSGSNGPFATVQKAMRHADAGDSVTIAGGEYAEGMDLRGKNITVKITGRVILH